MFLRFAVTDTGIGIAPENMARLFRPFVQIDSALNRQYSGTGLGLTLVKQIAELHGGQVQVSSDLGVGSCFSLDLPCVLTSLTPSHWAAFEASTEGSVENPVFETTLSPVILLAEDNEANTNTIASYLRAKGYTLHLAQDGHQALASALAHPPDLILMDIQMPGMDGLTALEQIRRLPALASVPVIALTALASPSDEDRCLSAGANAYLTKPIRLSQLANLIATLISTSGRPSSSPGAPPP